MDRSPRAPVLRSIALRAMARRASSRNSSSTPSISNSLRTAWSARSSALSGSGHQRRLVELVERRDHRQTADELRDQAVLDQILRLHLMAAVSPRSRRFVDLLRTSATKPMPPFCVRCWMIFSRPAKAPPQMNRMFEVSTCRNSCCGMLAAALRRHRGDRAFDQLQQRLLHAFARNVAGDGRVVRLARDLVDLVDVDDAASAPSRRRSRTSAAASG
jgi:hypothetical protein